MTFGALWLHSGPLCGISKALALSKESLFSCKKKEENKIIPFVHTYNPNNPNMFQIIHDSLPVIRNDSLLKTAFKDTKLLSSKWQSRNLKQILTKAAFFSKKRLTGGVKICGNKRCKTCPHFNETDQINLGPKQTEFHIRFPFTCHTKNLIYCITCQGCKKQCIGETGDILRNRVMLLSHLTG